MSYKNLERASEKLKVVIAQKFLHSTLIRDQKNVTCCVENADLFQVFTELLYKLGLFVILVANLFCICGDRKSSKLNTVVQKRWTS